jgi:hypothetical protein
VSFCLRQGLCQVLQQQIPASLLLPACCGCKKSSSHA